MPAKVLTDAQRKQKLRINLIKLKMSAKSPKNCYVPDEDKCFLQIVDKRANRTLSLVANKKWSFRRIYEFVLDSWRLSHTVRHIRCGNDGRY